MGMGLGGKAEGWFAFPGAQCRLDGATTSTHLLERGRSPMLLEPGGATKKGCRLCGIAGDRKARIYF